jgi:hypothetical protein
MVDEYYKDVWCWDYSFQGCDNLDISNNLGTCLPKYTALHDRRFTLIFITVTPSNVLRSYWSWWNLLHQAHGLQLCIWECKFVCVRSYIMYCFIAFPPDTCMLSPHVPELHENIIKSKFDTRINIHSLPGIWFPSSLLSQYICNS